MKPLSWFRKRTNPLRINKTILLGQLNKELSKPEYDHVTEENKELYVKWIDDKITKTKYATLMLLSKDFEEESRKMKIALGFKEKAYE